MAEVTSYVWSEVVLEQYFKMLSGFAHDQAKELVDREKSSQVSTGPSPSSPPSPTPVSNASSCRVALLNILGQLSLAEKTYHSMAFFVAKSFLRKDSSLRSSFDLILNELGSLKEASKVLNASAHLLSHLCDQIAQYITARMELIDFYERLGMSRPDSTFTNWPDSLDSVKKICDKSHKLFHHPLLGPIKSAFDFETEALVHLIDAQVQLQDYNFLASVLSLNEASAKLTSWDTLTKSCEEYRVSSKYGLTGVMSSWRSPPERALYKWFTAFEAALVSKFSFYFYNVLSDQAVHQPERFKFLYSRLSVDYYQKVAAFHRRTDAVAVILAFDADGKPIREGYRFPLRYPAYVEGLESIPAISCYPQKPATSLGQLHWPAIIMLMCDPLKSSLAVEHPVMFYDLKIDFTYFFMRVEPRITLVVLFRGRKSERDGTVISFMTDMNSNLRSSKLLQSLRPRFK